MTTEVKLDTILRDEQVARLKKEINVREASVRDHEYQLNEHEAAITQLKKRLAAIEPEVTSE